MLHDSASLRWTPVSQHVRITVTPGGWGIIFNNKGADVGQEGGSLLICTDSETRIKEHVSACLRSHACSRMFGWCVVVFIEICWHRMRLFRPSFFFTEQSATCQLPVPAEPGLLQNQGGWPDEQVTVKHTNHCSSLKLSVPNTSSTLVIKRSSPFRLLKCL